MQNEIRVQKNRRILWKLPFSIAEFSLVLRSMLLEAACADSYVDLALLDDADMEQLNTRHAGCACPTNVLSFPLPGARAGQSAPLKRSKDTPARCLGCLALSADTLLRECFLYAQDAEEHCIRLLAHALAHLLGLEHGPQMDRLTESLERAGHAACAARRSRM